MFKISLKIVVPGFKKKTPYKDILFVWQMLIMFIFEMKSNVKKKIEFEGNVSGNSDRE